MLPSFLVTNTVGADHALTLCSIWPSSSNLSTSSCCILIFLGDSFLGLQRIGLVDPVSISSSIVSVRPVIGVPGYRKRVDMFSQKIGCAHALVARESTCCVKHVDQVGWKSVFFCAAFGLASNYILYGLNFLHDALCVFGPTQIITELHLQCFDSLVQGSELYSSIGTLQSSASARTNDLPTNIPNSCTKVCSASTTPAVGPRRPLLVFSFAHSITSECGGMQTVSAVSARHSVAAWNR